MPEIDIRMTDNSREIEREFESAVERALTQIGLRAERFAKEELSKPKPHADGTNRPNVDTGNLRNSISSKVQMRGENSVYIGTNVEYAPYVELGTSRMAKFPFIKPAASEHSDVYRRILEDELKG